MINYKILQHKTETSDGRKVWYIAEMLGIVMELDLETLELKCIKRIPVVNGQVSHRGIFYFSQKLYIIPFYDDKLYIYDTETGKFDACVLGTMELMSCVERDEYLYFYGWRPVIVKYNPRNQTIEYIQLNLEEALPGHKVEHWFWTESFSKDGCIYLPVQNTNLLVRLDENDRASFFCLGKDPEKWVLRSVGCNEENFFSIYSEGAMENLKIKVSVYSSKGDRECICDVDIGSNYVIYPFTYAIYVSGKWFIMPYGMNCIYAIDLKTEILAELYSFDYSLIKNVANTKNGLFTCVFMGNDGCIWSINQVNGKLFQINAKTQKVVEHDVVWNKKASYEVLTGTMDQQFMMIETEEFVELEDFLNYVVQ